MFKVICASFTLLVLFAGSSWANEDVVTRQLDEYARDHELSPVNISTPPAGPEPRQKTFRKGSEFEFGVERYGYKYEEVVDASEFMDLKGFYNGLRFSYTFRPIDIDCFKGWIVNMFKFDGRFASGRVDYTGSGTWNGLKDYMYEVRGLTGYDFDINPYLRFTPFIGLGFRYLNDGAEAMPARFIDGVPYYSGYNRESKYYYMPLGFDIYREFPVEGWGLGMNMEYDFWLAGRQASHLEDSVDMTGTGSGYDPLYNRQKKGFGWRAAVKIDKVIPGGKLSLEPYYRFWKVKDSEVSFMTKNGEMVPGPTPGTYEAGLEPQNTTQEVGVKMGLIF